jgi:hypothetical protein
MRVAYFKIWMRHNVALPSIWMCWAALSMIPSVLLELFRSRCIFSPFAILTTNQIYIIILLLIVDILPQT